MDSELSPELLGHIREVLLKHLGRNRRNAENPNAAFFYGFSAEQLHEVRVAIPEALRQLSRPFGVVECAGMTCREFFVEAARALGAPIGPDANIKTASTALDEALLHSAVTLVVVGLSDGKFSRKPSVARQLIKTLDDAWLHGFRPVSDILFIDRASFVEAAWPDIGSYLVLVPPIDLFEAWLDKINPPTDARTLVSVE